MSATTATQTIKFYSEKSKAKRALKAIGDKALAAADTLLSHEGSDSKRWGFVVAAAEALQAGVEYSADDELVAEVPSAPTVTESILQPAGNDEAEDEKDEEAHKPMMNGGFASMLGQMMGQSVAPADAQSPSEKKAAPKVTTGQKIEKDRPMQNGVKRPSVGGMCRAVWDALDGLVAAGTAPTAKDVKALSETQGWNANNASIEFYQWRKFNGIKGRQVKA